MDFDTARQTVLELLRREGQAKNSQMIGLLGGDAVLFERVREDLLFCDLVEDKKGAGLVYTGPKEPAAPAPPAEAPAPPATVAAARRVFISYGRADAKDLAHKLQADLQAAGHTVWLDVREMKPGGSWEQQIEEAVLSCDVFIGLLTPHAVRRPHGVCLDEISMARYHGKRIIPAMVLQCRPPLGIYRLDYVDLLDWATPAGYAKGLSRVLEAMNKQGEGVEGSHAAVFSRLRPLDFGADLARLTRDFTGRQWLEAELQRWLECDNSRVFFVTGDPGTGKSAMLAHWVARHPQVAAFHFCSASLADSLDPLRFVRSIAAQLATQLPAYRAALEAADLEAAEADAGSLLRRLVADPLKAEKPDKPALIVVDALDEAALHQGRTIVQTLRDRLDDLPPWVRLVLSSRKEPLILDSFSRFSPHEIDAASEQNLQDVAAYLDAKLRELPSVLAMLREGANLVATARAILTKGEGNFLYVTQVIAALAAGRLDPRRPDDFPIGLVGIYQSFFDRLFPGGRDYAPFRPLLEVMSAAREPLTAQQIAEFLGRDTFDVENDLQKVAAFFPERGGLYRPYHKSVTDYLSGAAGQDRTYRLNLPAAHARIGAALLARRARATMDRFLLAHLPHHLTAAERWDDLEAVLADWRFLEGKTEAGMVFELAEDFTTAMRLIPADRPWHQNLRLVEEALRRDLQFIARHPMALFQCLWNTCWWYDCAGAADHYDAPPDGWPPEGPPWQRPGAKLCDWTVSWRAAKAENSPGLIWLRSLRPPQFHLGGAQRAVFRGHEGGVESVAWSPDGSRLASASRDKTVRVWDAASGRELACLHGHERDVNSVAWSPDGSRLASASEDKTVRVWDAASGRELVCLRGYEEYVLSVAWSPDGSRLASASRDKTVRVWDAASGRELTCLRGHKRRVNSVAWSPDGSRLASASEDKTVRVWDAASGRELACLRGHEHYVWSVAWSPDGSRLASASSDNTVRVWDAASGRELACLRGHENLVVSVAWSPDSSLLASASWDKSVRVWDAASGRELACLRGHEGHVNSVAWSPDGSRLASASDDKTVRVWDAASGRELACLRGHKNLVVSVAWSPDGRRLASASGDKTVRVWDVANGRELASLRGHKSEVNSVAWSLDGSRLASAGRDETVRVWDAANGRELACLGGHKSVVNSVAWSPDGSRLASASSDNTVRVWDAASGRELACLRGHKSSVWSVAWSPDGSRLASASLDNTVRVWDAASGRELACLRGHEESVKRVAWSPDGSRLASASKDKTVRVWDAASGACIEVIKGSKDVHSAVGSSSEGGYSAWRARGCNQETVIEPAEGEQPLAFFPAELGNIAMHPAGRIWAGAVANYVCIFVLEGEMQAGAGTG